MSTFAVPVLRLSAVESVPDSDFLEAAVVGAFRSVVRKGEFRAGDLAAYIPEGALVPQDVLEALGLWDAEKGKGKLDGGAGNRVKARTLRGVLSQGLVLPVRDGAVRLAGRDVPAREGDSIAEALGVEKYVPPIPAGMSGDVCVPGVSFPRFDVENIRRFPDALVEGEEVVVTEKLHGTCCLLGVVPGLERDDLLGGDAVCASKGLLNSDLSLKTAEGQNPNTLYVHVLREWQDKGRLAALRERAGGEPLFVLGEVFGPGVQDLHYGLKDKGFRAFAAYAGHGGHGRWLDSDELDALLALLGVERTPVLYRGPWSPEAVLPLARGQTVFGEANVREGVVITPARERRDPRFGRVCMKEVSPEYLLRKNKNATEYQ